MGTRVDFYIGKGNEAEWIGSYPWDGYPSNKDMHEIFKSESESVFRERVDKYLKNHIDDGATFPEQGWPWPWDDSGTTDYSYSFFDGKVNGSCYGSQWFDPFNEPEHEEISRKIEFPDMKSKKRATIGPRSGLILIQAKS